MSFRIYIDKSSVEVFVNDGEIVFSSRIYPEETETDIVFIPEEKTFNIANVTFHNLVQSVPDPRMD